MERAACIAGYVERTFTDDETKALAESGISALPRNLWEVYERILTTCAFADPAALRAVAEDSGSPP